MEKKQYELCVEVLRRLNKTRVLKDLGFVVGFQGREGYIRLEHPDLAIEFLVPEKGRGSNKPVPLKELGINAQPLRYLSPLTQKIIHAEVDGIKISLPHPVVFAFHKLIIATLRKNEDKAAKDVDGALRILKAVLNKGEITVVKIVFDSMLPTWRKKILQCLKKMGEEELLRLLE